MEIVCRNSGIDEEGQHPYESKNLGDHEEWCTKGVTCKRPSDPKRDDIGFYELEERQSLNDQLLRSWNRWARSPYCQCTYSTDHPPETERCSSCNRPMNPQAADELPDHPGIDREESERTRRSRAGPTWIVVYENTVRAAEVALKLLIKAAGPAPEGQPPSFGKHNLKALWEQLPPCMKHEVRMEIFANSHDRSGPHVITATGEKITEPLPLQDQPVFDRFGEEFNDVRYAWDKLTELGIERINEYARDWPDPIHLYYLYLGTQTVLSVLKRQPWNSHNENPRANTRVQVSLGLDESHFHSDWPPTYIVEEPMVLNLRLGDETPE